MPLLNYHYFGATPQRFDLAHEETPVGAEATPTGAQRRDTRSVRGGRVSHPLRCSL